MVNFLKQKELEGLSAFMDGELSDQGFMLHSASQGAAGDAWRIYHLIGQTLRSEADRYVGGPDRFERMCRAIDQQGALVPPQISLKASLGSVSRRTPFVTKPAVRPRGHFGTWLATAAAIGFVSWSVISLNTSMTVQVEQFARRSHVGATVAAAPQEWQERLMDHQAAYGGDMAMSVSPIVRANLSTVKIDEVMVADADSFSEDGYDWLRLWETRTQQPSLPVLQ
ncbi:MAG: RseA family anti-sigma factor [Burkholderiaceae bacterium]|jgi:hypothetical protein